MKFYARVSSRVPFLYLKNKQPNLAFLRSSLLHPHPVTFERAWICTDDIRGLLACKQRVGDAISFKTGRIKFTTFGAHDVIAITSPQKNDLGTEEL